MPLTLETCGMRSKRTGHPFAPLALLQQQAAVADADERDRILRIDHDFEVRRHVRGRLQQRIGRAGDVGRARSPSRSATRSMIPPETVPAFQFGAFV